jgi:hypothetical protein
MQHFQIAGNPLEPLILRLDRKIPIEPRLELGYSKNSKDWAIRSQALN